MFLLIWGFYGWNNENLDPGPDAMTMLGEISTLKKVLLNPDIHKYYWLKKKNLDPDPALK